MKIWILGILIPTLLPAATLKPKLTVVTKSQFQNGFTSLLLHNNILWVGHNAKDGVDDVIEALDLNGKRKFPLVKLNHTGSYLYPFGPNQILVLGKHVGTGRGEWYSRFTLISTKTGRVEARTELPPPLVDQFGGTPDQMFFADQTDREVMHWNGKALEPFMATQTAPSTMFLLGSLLFINEIYHDVAVTDISKPTEKFLFNQENDFVNVVYLSNTDKIAAVNKGRQKIELLGVRSGDRSEIHTSGSADGTAQFGRCLAVVNADNKMIEFYNLSKADELVESWDLNELQGDDYVNARALAIDEASKGFFVRFSNPHIEKIGGGFTLVNHAPVVKMEAPEKSAIGNCL